MEVFRIYQEFRQHLIDSRHKSFEQFDKAVFILSGGGLTISLTILKDITPFASASSMNLLVASWFLFVSPLVLTLLSFIFSQKALDRQIELTDQYFQDEDESALDKPNIFAKITQYVNYLSAVLFISGAIALLRFVYINILK